MFQRVIYLWTLVFLNYSVVVETGSETQMSAGLATSTKCQRLTTVGSGEGKFIHASLNAVAANKNARAVRDSRTARAY